MALHQNLSKHFSNKLAPVLLDVYVSWEKKAPWPLLLEQEWYFQYPSPAKSIRYNNR